MSGKMPAKVRALAEKSGVGADVIYVGGVRIDHMSKSKLVEAVIKLHAENVDLWRKLNGLMGKWRELRGNSIYKDLVSRGVAHPVYAKWIKDTTGEEMDVTKVEDAK